MPWVRCPFGCIYQMSETDWYVYSNFPASIICDSCHRRQPFENFSLAEGSKAVDAVDGAFRPELPAQLELEKTVQLRMSKVMGNINWFGYCFASAGNGETPHPS